MTNIIVIANQKGGIGKTTIASTLAYLLSTDAHEKLPAAQQRRAERVLLVDTDFQADSTAFLTRMERDHFNGKSLLEAIDAGDATEYIHKVTDTLHVLPASAHLALFEQLFFENRDALDAPHKMLDLTLKAVSGSYEWVIIDTSPSLSQMKLQALNVTLDTLNTHVIIPLQTETFGLESVYQFADTLTAVSDKTNPQLNLLGIVPVLTDNMTIDKEVISEAQEAFEGKIMQTVIKRRSELKKMARNGISEHYAAQREALQDFYRFTQEVRERVKRES